jgi:hypothetical protein
MDKKTAAITLQFLQRLNLTGAEAPAFMAVSNAIRAIVDGSLVVVPPPMERREHRPDLQSFCAGIAALSGEEMTAPQPSAPREAR